MKVKVKRIETAEVKLTLNKEEALVLLALVDNATDEIGETWRTGDFQFDLQDDHGFDEERFETVAMDVYHAINDMRHKIGGQNNED